MKYIVLVGDGMADYPIAELQGRTPLEVAHTPNMDFIAKAGRLGRVKTIPSGMNPASDVANISIMGYDPRTCYTGRGPLEAANLGIELQSHDVAFRCNLVTVSEDTLVDYSAGHIKSEEARLARIHQGDFDLYRERTRAFFPKLNDFKEPDEYVVKPIIFRKNMMDAIWFILLVALLSFTSALHQSGVLPAFFSVY